MSEKAHTHTDVEFQSPAESKMNIGHAENVVGTVQLFDSAGQIRKIPIPTDNPRDPLTWPTWKRVLIICSICAYGISGFGVVQSTPLFFSEIIGDYMEATRGTFVPSKISDLASYPSLCMGLGNFLFIPMSLSIGRRPIFLLCNALALAANVWAAKSGDFSSHLGARCLQGLSCGISDCMLPLIVLDVTFLHKRSKYMGIYWAFTAIGSSLLLVVVPFVVHHASDNWRVNYWFWTAFSAFSFILALFFLPETFFYREPAMLDGKIVVSDAYGQVRILASPEAAERDAIEVPKGSPDTANKPSASYSTSLSLVSGISPNPVKSFLEAYIDMAICFATPAVFWTLLVNIVLFGGLVALSLTYAQALEAPPWAFQDQLVGTVQLGSAIGAGLALLITGVMVKYTSSSLSKRHSGVHEPEHILPSFILPLLSGFFGLMTYGIVAGSPSTHHWIGIYAAFALYYCAFVAISAITSVWLAEVLPSRAGPAIVLVCGGRNVASFGISYSFIPWITAVGFRNAHISLGCILLGLGLFGIPLYFGNKSLRRMTAAHFS